MNPAWCLLALAIASPSGERSYRILVDGRDDGVASLAIQARPDGTFDYRWHSQIGVSRTPCLWSEERRSGNYRRGSGRPLPDELALSLLPPDSKGELTVTLDGQQIHAVLGRDGLPDRVDLVDLGLSYVMARPETLAWDRCGKGTLERGPELVGAGEIDDPRRIRRTTFERIDSPGGWRSVAVAAEGPLPDIANDLVVRAFERAPGRDCKLVASELAQALERGGFHARVVAGWIVAHGALWPHAWTELQDRGEYRAIDATTGRGWADAARIKVGTLDTPDAAEASGRRLLRERHARIRLVDYWLAP